MPVWTYNRNAVIQEIKDRLAAGQKPDYIARHIKSKGKLNSWVTVQVVKNFAKQKIGGRRKRTSEEIFGTKPLKL